MTIGSPSDSGTCPEARPTPDPNTLITSSLACPEEIRDIPNSIVCPDSNSAIDSDTLSISSDDGEPTEMATLDDKEEEGCITYHVRRCTVCFTWVRTVAMQGPMTKSLAKVRRIGGGSVGLLADRNEKVYPQALPPFLYPDKTHRKTKGYTIKCH